MHRVIGMLLLWCCFAATAQVYKWVDEKGVVHYTDQPPAKNSTPAKLPPLQTFKGGAVPNLEQFARPTEQKAAAGPVKVRITSPSADETFRGDSVGQLTVSVSLAPGLEAGQTLVYYVNGAAQGGPTTSLTKKLDELERGSHNIAVAVLGAGGKEVARDSVTVHVKQATAKR